MNFLGLMVIAMIGGVEYQDPEPGISIELARQRSARISNVRYDLRFDLETGSEQISGGVRIFFDLPDEQPSEAVVLDCDQLLIDKMYINGASLEAPPPVTNGHLVLPASSFVPIGNRVTITFETKVAATGTPLTRYRDPTDGNEYLYTLVVPSDAHRLFPCFDQPDLKARFRLRLTTPNTWQAVSNGETIDDPDFPRLREDNRLNFVFARSKPISTYLFAFSAGPFDIIEDNQGIGSGDTPDRATRIFVRPSKRPELDSELLFAKHRDSVRWLADYFGIEYPFGKLDFVLLPGFPYGGMEHAGAIFYREASLVFDHTPTESEQIRRSTLIYHEVSHQWFGNLVTMKWFDDLWLKEGFATFCGYSLLEVLEPGKNAWLRFHQRVKPYAYAVDGTRGTTPVYQKLKNLADAKSAYGAIVYNKAPAVLRELQARLGPANFQRGVQIFLREHAFGNARWNALVEAFEKASNQKNTLWSNRWILSPGMPKVQAVWTTKDGVIDELAIEQESTLKGSRTKDSEAEDREAEDREAKDEELWPLSLEVLLLYASGESSTLRMSTHEARTVLTKAKGMPAPLCVLLNPKDIAYGLFVLDPTSRDYLLEHTHEIEDLLLRAVALSALYNTEREGDVNPAAYAALAHKLLKQVEDPLTHAWILGSLGTTINRYLDQASAEDFRTRVGETLVAQLIAGLPGRELQTFRFLAKNCSNETTISLLNNLLDGKSKIPGLELGQKDRFLAATALFVQGRPEPLANETRNAKGDQSKQIYLAEAATATAEAKERVFASYLNLSDPPEQWSLDSLSRFHWSGQSKLTIPYLRKALDQVEWVKANRKIFYMPAWIDSFINGHSSEKALETVEAFLSERQDLSADIVRKILQSSDELKRAVSIRARWKRD